MKQSKKSKEAMKAILSDDPESRHPTSFRLDNKSISTLNLLSNDSGMEKTAIVELLIDQGRPIIEDFLRQRLDAIAKKNI